ncbi:UNVERIFIED_CONTAM: ferredoxin [Williamsia faeni]
MAMKIKADFDLCESNGVCVGMAPDVFDLDDDDYLVILKEDVPEERREEMRQVVSSCPKSALSVEE